MSDSIIKIPSDEEIRNLTAWIKSERRSENIFHWNDVRGALLWGLQGYAQAMEAEWQRAHYYGGQVAPQCRTMDHPDVCNAVEHIWTDDDWLREAAKAKGIEL